MELKKNPKADVRLNGSIYFAVGLLLMLVVTYYTINYKSYDKSGIDIGLVSNEMPPMIGRLNAKMRCKRSFSMSLYDSLYY